MNYKILIFLFLIVFISACVKDDSTTSMEAIVAMEEGDYEKALSLCNQISVNSPDAKNQCYRKVALATNDYTVCSKMVKEEEFSQSSTKKEWICYKLIAQQIKDSTICNLIKNDFLEECNILFKEATCNEWLDDLSILQDCYKYSK